MKIIVDLMYNNHIIDARCIQVTKPKGQVATTSIDLTSTINKQISMRKAAQRVIDQAEKELDAVAIHP